MKQYVELAIENNSGNTSPISSNTLYISLYADGIPYLIDADTGICTAGAAGGKAIPVQCSTLTGNTLKLDAATQMVSGRLYFSSSNTVISAGGPSITSCPDYFDWLEFTLNGPSLSSKQFVINTTQVDQFGFPITLSKLTPADPAFGSTAGCAKSATRSSIFTAFGKLPTAYADCLLANTVATEPPLRILSPANAIVNNTTSKLASTFNDVLKRFFQQPPYEPKPGQLVVRTPVYIDSVAGYPYIGLLTKVSEMGTDGKMHNYPVLQFNYAGATEAPNPLGIETPPASGTGPYNIYFPFFNTNSESSFPAPPYWWKSAAGSQGGSLPEASTASQMVFAANGVFADNAFQFSGPQTYYSAIQQQIIGNLENQLNVAFNRGFANSIKWITLTGSIASSSEPKNSAGLYETTVTLGEAFLAQDLPNANINLSVGMEVFSYASSQPLKISEIPNPNGTTFTVTSEKEILAQNPQYLSFSYFYEGIEAENSYAKFFHQASVSIDGRAYAMPFDDQGGFSSTLTSNWTTTPTTLTITLGPWD